MNDYVIMTDSSCDLPGEMAVQHHISILPLTVNLEGKEYLAGPGSDRAEATRFYRALRAGRMAFTAAVSRQRFLDSMEQALKNGRDILYLSFASVLSETYRNACQAAGELREKYPQRNILCVDSRCASLGQGLLVMLAACFREEQGGDIFALERYLNERIPHICHWFTVDDLLYLKRSGKNTAGAAPANALLDFKPILHVDDEGRLVNVEKVKGRTAAIARLAEKTLEDSWDLKEQTVFISHCDCLEDAEKLADLIRKRGNPKSVVINSVCAVIGAHSGPGTLAVFFLGDRR